MCFRGMVTKFTKKKKRNFLAIYSVNGFQFDHYAVAKTAKRAQSYECEVWFKRDRGGLLDWYILIV